MELKFALKDCHVSWLDCLPALTRSSGRYRLAVLSCSSHEAFDELFKAGRTHLSQPGGPAGNGLPLLSPLKHLGGELKLTGPGLSVEQSCFTPTVTENP